MALYTNARPLDGNFFEKALEDKLIEASKKEKQKQLKLMELEVTDSLLEGLISIVNAYKKRVDLWQEDQKMRDLPDED